MLAKHNVWEPIKLSRDGPALSHLYFADDLILFAKATTEQVQVIKGALDIFCKSSGQKVNFSKSCVFFSKKVPHLRRNELSQELGIKLTSDLGRYLGVPLLHNKCSKQYFQFVLDRMETKLNGWNMQNLSLAGRCTLAQSVLASIPSYPMQTMKIPMSICERIDRICRNFIWGALLIEEDLIS